MPNILTEGKRNMKEYETALRYQFRLKQAIEMQRWVHDVLIPELNALEMKGVEGLVVDSQLVELEGFDEAS